jgi:hypothetical protein
MRIQSDVVLEYRPGRVVRGAAQEFVFGDQRFSLSTKRAKDPVLTLVIRLHWDHARHGAASLCDDDLRFGLSDLVQQPKASTLERCSANLLLGHGEGPNLPDAQGSWLSSV